LHEKLGLPETLVARFAISISVITVFVFALCIYTCRSTAYSGPLVMLSLALPISLGGWG
jgi:hypothetical protein